MRASSFLICVWCIITAPGCIVIPIGDLLKGPVMQEQVLVEGAGFFSKEKIAIVDIRGVIEGDERQSLLFPQENVVAETKAQLEFAGSDSQVKAVVLRVSSPGGEVTACDTVAREIRKFRERTKIPVVGCIGDIGASGGYYVAVSSDVLYAHPTSIVGSIGVILQHFDLSGLLEKVGVSSTPVKSSPKKDINSLFRPLTDEERQILQKLVDDMYKRFVDTVAEGRRDLSREQVLSLADGRVVSGMEAATLKLVDKVGYMEDAVAEAQRLGKIESPTIVRYTRVAKSGANIYTQLGSDRPAAGEIRLTLGPGQASTPRLYYLWQPGS